MTAVLRNTFSKDPFVTVTGDGSSLNETRQGGIPEEVADWAALAYLTECALAPIRHLRPADAGVCASRSGGGASDSKTLPEYSPRPACDGGGHCATAGTPTQNAAYACGV